MPITDDDIKTTGEIAQRAGEIAQERGGNFGTAAGVALAAGGTGAAIGGAIGAAVVPLSFLTAPMFAAAGAAIAGIGAFLFTLFKKSSPTPEELAAAQAAHEAAVLAMAKPAAFFSTAAHEYVGVWPKLREWSKALAGTGQGSSLGIVEQGLIMREKENMAAIAKDHPEWAGMVNNLIAMVDWQIDHPSAEAEAGLDEMVKIIDALANMNPELGADPLVYLRSPLSEKFGPALAAAGINIADPKVVAMMRANYDAGAAKAAYSAFPMSIPITRKSVADAKNAAAGNPKYTAKANHGVAPWKLVQWWFDDWQANGPTTVCAYDTRAFPENQQLKGERVIAPYGVDPGGTPLTAPWPYGLDADNFALPKPKSIVTPTHVVVGGGILALGLGALFFL